MRSRFKSLENLLGSVHAFFLRHWKRALRVRERIHISEDAFHLILAGGVGVIGALVNLLFFACIEWATQLLLRHTGDPVEIAELLGPWQRMLAPTIGGLGAGLVLYWGSRIRTAHGPTNMLEVVVAGDGRLRFRPALVKAVSSLLTIGSGGSIGREGAITQLTATLSSKWGQLAKWHPYRLRLLVACGAASGISAAYNAPVAGAVFAAMIVLGNFSMNHFAPLVFASVVSSVVSRSFFGIRSWYEVPAFDFTKVTQLPWFLVLGVACGVLGSGFMKSLNLSERLFGRLKTPVYARLALGGLLVGAIAVWIPQVWGNGYVVTNLILDGQYALQGVALIFIAKFVATSITVGSGAVGGVFTPTLFLGAGMGSLFGMGLHQLGFGEALPTGAFALVGMGSALAATTHSPLLAMILVFEISLNYSLMPPLMLACVVSTLVARRLHPDSIYTAPLKFKEFAAEREGERVGMATEKTIGELMRDPVRPLRETSLLTDIADRFLTSPNNFLPVVNDDQKLLGVVALQDLKEFLQRDEILPVIAYDVMRPPPPCVTPDQRILDALPTVLASEQRNVPVVNSLAENRLVGSVSRGEILGILSEALATGGRKPR